MQGEVHSRAVKGIVICIDAGHQMQRGQYTGTRSDLVHQKLKREWQVVQEEPHSGLAEYELTLQGILKTEGMN